MWKNSNIHSNLKIFNTLSVFIENVNFSVNPYIPLLFSQLLTAVINNAIIDNISNNAQLYIEIGRAIVCRNEQ